MTTTPIEVRILRPNDDRGAFSSGDPELDRFFRNYAGQNQFRHHIGTTYVAIAEGSIAGYATVSGSSILVTDLPRALAKRLPQYPMPVLRLARLARAESAAGTGVGKLLLRAVFQIARQMQTGTGCIGIVVDAKPGAVSFYERYGFRPLPVEMGTLPSRPTSEPMFLPMSSIPAG